MKITLAQLNPTVGALADNAQKILDVYNQNQDADLVVFSECVTTGYPFEDLAFNKKFIRDVMDTVTNVLLPATANSETGMLVGSPYVQNGRLYNSALLLYKGRVQYIYNKAELPNYGVFDEQRIFSNGTLQEPVDFKGKKLGIMICEDMWHFDGMPAYLGDQGVDVFIVLNGSPYEEDKIQTRLCLAKKIATSFNKPLIYVNQVGGQDELVFDGASFVMSGTGDFDVLPWFQEAVKTISTDATTFTNELISRDAATYNAVVLGLRDYLRKNGFSGVVLGLSGGVDSALVATIAADALGPENVLAVRLPSAYSSQGSLDDAAELAQRLGIRMKTVPIENVVNQFRNTLEQPFTNLGINDQGPESWGVTDENLQARARGVILMGLSNRTGYMLLSTSNASESCVGYGTLFGDLSGGFNPIKDLYKTRVFQLCAWRNKFVPDLSKCRKLDVIPESILTKAPSAELRPGQRDSDSLPPYDVLDDIQKKFRESNMTVDEIVESGHSREVVTQVCNTLYKMEYKRRLSPPGVKVTKRLFGRDWRYPISNSYREK